VIAVVLFAAALVPVPQLHDRDAQAPGYEKVPPPQLQRRVSEASATTVPWIDSNAWRFQRGLKKALYADLPLGSGPLAAAEGYAWGADLLLEPAPKDAADVGEMLAFITRVNAPRMPTLANLGVVDDGSEEIPEVLNLLSRRNLLYKVIKEEDPKLDLNIRLGSKQFPKDSARNPNDFAARVRERLGDEKRLVRIFNSYSVLTNLTGAGDRRRLHLVNYARLPAKDVRVRVSGVYEIVMLADSADPAQQARDIVIADGGTEFTLGRLTTYAVVDLEPKH